MSCHQLGKQPVLPAHHTAFLRTPAVISNGEIECFSWNNWHKKGSHIMPFNLRQMKINQLARLCHQRSKGRVRPKQAGGPDRQSKKWGKQDRNQPSSVTSWSCRFLRGQDKLAAWRAILVTQLQTYDWWRCLAPGSQEQREASNCSTSH